jgi:hypothetical protein
MQRASFAAFGAIVALSCACRGSQPVTDGPVPEPSARAIEVALVIADERPSAGEEVLIGRLRDLALSPKVISRARPAALPKDARAVVLAPGLSNTLVDEYRDLALPIVTTSVAHAKILGLAVGGPVPQALASRVDVGLPEEPCVGDCAVDGDAASNEVVRAGEIGELGRGLAALSSACAGGLPRWSAASPEALTIAHEKGRPDHLLAFAYDARAAMAHGVIAAERRVAAVSCSGGWGEGGLQIFDAAARWAATPVRATPGTVRGTPVLADGVRVFGDDVSIVVFRDRLALEWEAAPATPPAVDQIVVGRAMGGFARRITKILRADGGRYEVETTQADLAEIFAELDFALGGAPTSTDAGVASTRQALGESFGLEFGTGAFALGPYCEAAFTGAVSIARSIDLAARPIAELEIGRDGLRRAKLALEATGSASVSIGATAGFSASCKAAFEKLPKTRWSTTTPVPVPTPIGPIVVPVTIQHEVRPIVEVEAGGSLSAGSITGIAEGTIGLTVGAKYEDSKWASIFEPNATSDARVEVADVGLLTLNATARIGFEYVARVYGLVGPRIRGLANVTGEFSAKPGDCKWNARADLSLDALFDLAGPGPDCSEDASIDEDFERRFPTFGKYDGVGAIDEKKRQVARDWYRKARCESSSIALGRFDEFQRTGLPYLNVVPGSDWSMQANLGWLYGAIDRGGTFTMATDPRSPRAKLGDKKPADGGGACNRLTITATEVSVLDAEGYRYLYKTLQPTPNGPCGCLGVIGSPREQSDWCDFGPVPTLPVAIPRKLNLASLASLKVTLFKTPLAEKEGTLPLPACKQDAGPPDAAPDTGPEAGPDPSPGGACVVEGNPTGPAPAGKVYRFHCTAETKRRCSWAPPTWDPNFVEVISRQPINCGYTTVAADGCGPGMAKIWPIECAYPEPVGTIVNGCCEQARNLRCKYLRTEDFSNGCG